MKILLKQPSAWIPISMSLAALALLIIHLAIFGIVREADEGTVVHIWQLLMAGQLPVILYFAIKWLPQNSKKVVQVLFLQIAVMLIAAAPVFLLGL
jgi:hypothetical protein